MSTSAHGGSVPSRILVVDDAPAIRAALRALLKDAGFVVVGEAGDGDQGVAMPRRRRRLRGDGPAHARPGRAGGEQPHRRHRPRHQGAGVSTFDGQPASAPALDAARARSKGCRPELVVETLHWLCG